MIGPGVDGSAAVAEQQERAGDVARHVQDQVAKDLAAVEALQAEMVSVRCPGVRPQPRGASVLIPHMNVGLLIRMLQAFSGVIVWNYDFRQADKLLVQRWAGNHRTQDKFAHPHSNVVINTPQYGIRCTPSGIRLKRCTRIDTPLHGVDLLANIRVAEMEGNNRAVVVLRHLALVGLGGLPNRTHSLRRIRRRLIRSQKAVAQARHAFIGGAVRPPNQTGSGSWTGLG